LKSGTAGEAFLRICHPSGAALLMVLLPRRKEHAQRPRRALLKFLVGFQKSRIPFRIARSLRCCGGARIRMPSIFHADDGVSNSPESLVQDVGDRSDTRKFQIGRHGLNGVPLTFGKSPTQSWGGDFEVQEGAARYPRFPPTIVSAVIRAPSVSSSMGKSRMLDTGRHAASLTLAHECSALNCSLVETHRPRPVTTLRLEAPAKKSGTSRRVVDSIAATAIEAGPHALTKYGSAYSVRITPAPFVLAVGELPLLLVIEPAHVGTDGFAQGLLISVDRPPRVPESSTADARSYSFPKTLCIPMRGARASAPCSMVNIPPPREFPD